MNRNMLLNDEMIKKIIESKKFFYQKLKDYFQSYMRFDISDNELNELLNIVENKRPFSFKELIEQDYKYKDILQLIGKMILIFDANGYNKNIWNPYDDKRVIAKANVKQNIWTKNLIVYKLTKDITKLSSDSVKNAILYIQNPKMNLTQLSEEHRRETSNKLLKNEYNPDKYFEDIKNYFKDIFEDIKLNNDDNMNIISVKTKNIMLYGAPGVGKTYNYKKLVALIEGQDFVENEVFDFIINNRDDEILEGSVDTLYNLVKNEKRIEFITFHQSYSYEDFIEGFRPQKNGIIDREDGIFKTLCNEANKNSLKNFYIVIDEINRGNISKIFGELITLIEEDKRGKKEYEVTLPYSKKPFIIPSNLYIIATMNSTDKSIATIDIALRRRFTFLKMKPKEELVKNIQANKLMKDLNEHILKTTNEDYQLGHSYFMKIKDENDLKFVKEYKIKPLLEEYFYGDEENYNKALKILGLEDEFNKQ
ncbi:McrB family protein [Aliarcobacter butzleri]